MREQFTVQVKTVNYPSWVNLALFHYQQFFYNLSDAEKEIDLAMSEHLDITDYRILSRNISDWKSVKGEK